jgi:hypothetical protein
MDSQKPGSGQSKLDVLKAWGKSLGVIITDFATGIFFIYLPSFSSPNYL